MKKFVIYFVVWVLVLSVFSGCSKPTEDPVPTVDPAPTDETNPVLYKKFLAGEITSLDENGAEKAFGDYLTHSGSDAYTYAFLDMNGDGVLELCVRYQMEMFFFTIKNDAVHHWHTEFGGYTKLLNNGALLYERHGGAPTHIEYKYYELDANGDVKFSISFAWYDGNTVEAGKENPNLYLIDGNEVAQAEYEEKTKGYLAVGDDQIVWYDQDGNVKNG